MKNIKCRYLYDDGKVAENKEIICKDGKVIEVKDCEAPFDVECLSAAFFDTHINGGEEYYLTESNNAETIEDIFQSSVKTGTFYVLPTLITSSQENILKGIGVMKKYMDDHPESGVLGLHLEGPFLNPEKRGAHLAKYVRKPMEQEIDEILEAGKNVIQIWTIAPEQFTTEQIEKIKSAGVTISFGHSNATFEQAQTGFEQGVTLVTHLFNAMSGLHHRKPGLVGAAFANSDVWAPIIPDGKHVHFGAVKAAYKAKGEKLFIISDALFLGRKKLEFQWEEFDAKLVNGEYVNSEGNLAGSAISVGEAVKNMVEQVGVTLAEAIEMATLRPAKAVELDQKVGRIAKSYPAVFTVFDQSLENFEVLK
ncbi:N-acetylglucosamine-6-phosphate deacetylase [Jiulongibacter sediminis]|uniref:N-acetylglucosamine-6-phosphate deacetylase n=1 Tax=Jiulongibacter sediminis TaxID=1605367 RepID=UPI0026EEA823|nr:N-acetylglucosamine-6-phosphate deacetylase [Jiulongibacter sediminis]